MKEFENNLDEIGFAATQRYKNKELGALKS